MPPDDMVKLLERLAALEASFDALGDTLESKLSSEEKLHKSQWESLRVKLGGDIQEIKSIFQAHCQEQVRAEDTTAKSLHTLHRRIDEIFKVISERNNDIYERPVERMSRIEERVDRPGAGVGENRQTVTVSGDTKTSTVTLSAVLRWIVPVASALSGAGIAKLFF
ncbi:MAG TPA: hypothetical protein PK745_00530 [bacterium]|nr:hypothetical protein [bacterium]